MTNIEIRKPTDRDIRILVENLRPADQEEMKAYYNDNYTWQIKTSVKYSRDAWAVVVNGKLLFICGVGLTSMLGNVGCPWLLGTIHIADNKKEFYKQAQRIFGEMKANYDVLTNHVYAKNKTAVNFLKHLGFKIGEPEPYGKNGEMFHPFVTVA
ncbi:phage protein Gp13 family protein [Acinetobacter sp.]|uniref:phage protein Gp13 family protein n=1 Tax=Acinetobacter sp. TaxID=472 RepID=UPI002FD9EC81